MGNQLLDFLIDTGTTYFVLNTWPSKLSSETVSDWGVGRNLEKALSPVTRLSDGEKPSEAWLSTHA